MKVKLFGTRGSVPVAGKQYNEFGGNTTSLEIISDCLPKGHFLAIDAGSGFVPFSLSVLQRAKELSADIKRVVHLLCTHYHHDHNQGLFLSPLVFIKQFLLSLYGPVDHGVGPKEMVKHLMVPPYFPVHCREQLDHFTFKNLEFPNATVMVIHPRGGVKVLPVADFEKMSADGGHVPVGRKGKYPIDECLIIRMFKSNHPEQTISYRFEERPTGKVFVLLTDNENQAGIPNDLRRHLTGVDLLIIDSQYTQNKYDAATAGFGHGTGKYCAQLGWNCDVKRVGLTHHDPFSGDEQVKTILNEAKSEIIKIRQGYEGPQGLTEEGIFACADYQEIQI